MMRELIHIAYERQDDDREAGRRIKPLTCNYQKEDELLASVEARAKTASKNRPPGLAWSVAFLLMFSALFAVLGWLVGLAYLAFRVHGI